MKNGWVRLWRKTQNKGWYKNSKYVHLWVHLLLEANHKPNEFMWNNNVVIIKEGQMITGRKALERGTGINEKTIDRILKCFENEQQIKQETTNKFRLITIINWKEYQGNEQQCEQQVGNRLATSGQQIGTNKNVKNDKNDKKYIAEASSADSSKKDLPMTLEEFVEWCRKSPRRYVKLMGEYADTIKPSFETKPQWEKFIKRNLRPAKDIEPYTDKQIEKAVLEIQKSMGEGWLKKYTLETVIKFLA